jgi:hypothetical protein
MRTRLLCLAAVLSVMVGSALAQDVSTGTLTGVVRDTSGGVLPGVSVEAASPALIEKVRSVVTDTDGRYRIIGVRPGAYSVTFSLTGFRTVKRESVELTSGFVATVDAELSVGAVSETITVTGANPVLDVKSSSQQQVLAGDVIRALPLPKTSGAYVVVLPGAIQNSLQNIDVGGNKGETENQFGIHGGRPNDGQTFREGQNDGHFFGPLGPGAASGVNRAAMQEVSLQLSGGLTAEAATSGVQVNTIYRDGGNVVSGTFYGDYGNKSLQASNVDAAQLLRGAGQSSTVKESADVGIGIGGPILKDKLWFFVDARRWHSYSYASGIFFNALQSPTQDSLFYVKDLARPAFGGTQIHGAALRLTWQATQKQKISGTYHYENGCNCDYNLANGVASPEATGSDTYLPVLLDEVHWTYAATNRLLFQAGGLGIGGRFYREPTGGSRTQISILDTSRNFRYGAPVSLQSTRWIQWNTNGSVSYVTGPHAFKAGYLFLFASRDLNNINNGNISYTFSGYDPGTAVPLSVTYYGYPLVIGSTIHQSAAYAQDQWSLNRWTLNLGVRLDHFYGYGNAETLPAGPFVPARQFPGTDNTPNWWDLNPRVGVAYNLFGKDRTVVKASIGRFVPYEPLSGIVLTANPTNASISTQTRTWRDANRDYVPQSNELGPETPFFGQSVIRTHVADDVISGFDKRPYSWQGSVSVQHELRTGFAVNVGYFRTWYGNFLATDNLAVTPADYQSFCVNTPPDSRLPNGGLGSVCGLLDLNPARVPFGTLNNLVIHASDVGKQTDVYNGVDFTVNARFGRGGLLLGGVTVARESTDNCAVLAALPEMSSGLLIPTANPTRFCSISPPLSAGTQFKITGSYPLPGSFRLSGNYQNFAGLPTTATYVATTTTNPEIATQLGRQLAAGANGTAQIELVQPQALYEQNRISLVSLSVGRNFRFKNIRVEPKLDVYNLFNNNSVENMVLRFGPSWQNITGIVPPRVVKLGARVDF